VRLKVASAASTVHNLRIEISPVKIFRNLSERYRAGCMFFRHSPMRQLAHLRARSDSGIHSPGREYGYREAQLRI
jgi:hypothetical protein